MPTLGFHVPDSSPLAKKVKARADAAHDGKVSSYVRQLVERDLSGEQATPEATGENILVELAERLRPDSAKMLGEWIASQGLNQPRLLGKLLDALADALMRDINNKVSYGDAPLVLVKILREDAHAVQAAYAFRQLSNDAQKLAFMFDPEINRKLAVAAAINAVTSKANKP
jgi:hypothetical protein